MDDTTIPGTVELTSIPQRTFIRIGFGTTIAADEIAAIVAYDPASDDGTPDVTNYAPDMSQVRDLIRLKSGYWYASRLSHRELDNRLRKAGAAIL